ncbi:HAMP domain-containing histidine kinase [Nitrosopumilus sp. K4]|uniref:HAMP domain-containing sensor histidine kinase n=1 Tax=Nitrosopumilus sp. K4 TaxID=2795383 RepID=UPI001BA8F377|nr:HAMP domain-containing sensor histidine kinase [Nitrosopumilus sp. K4]QUC65465.1 HAMP domain-containing histidine kinase [Nitrosopumilus sp. K4]
MLQIKHTLFLVFGITSFIIFYIGLLNYFTSDDHDMASLILVFTIIVSGGSLIGTIFVSKSITSPIEKLAQNMTEFSETNKIDSNEKIITNIKEIHELNTNFQNMTKTVHDTIKKEKQYVEKLKDIDRRKDEFSSMVSHELKTPIVPILGYAKMLKKQDVLGRLNPMQEDAVNEIYTSSLKLQKLIGDILTAQKLGLGKIAINKEKLDTGILLEDVFKTFDPIVKEKKVQLIKVNSDKSFVYSDKDRIIQVFSNLIKNALDFVDEGSGKIEFGAKENNEHIEFFVKDNGIGISEENQKEIFKKFYQIDTSNRRKRDGSGLGLAICKGIIEKLDGKIWVESKFGHGSTFYFSIPKKYIKIES